MSGVTKKLMSAAGKSLEIGDFYEGGFYAGNIFHGGVEYQLIVAPKSLGEHASRSFKTSNDASPAGTRTLNNGASSTASTPSSHPAAAFCASRNINGFSDWYLPARDELELLYRNLKAATTLNDISNRELSSITYPEGNDVSADTMGVNRNSNPLGSAYTSADPAKTPLTDFMEGGAEAFTNQIYWSSTEFSNTNAWLQSFNNGDQGRAQKSTTRYVRAVRRVAV